MRSLDGRDLFGRAAGDDASAVRAAFWSKIDDEVCALDHVEIMLNHDDCVADADESLKHVEQLMHISEVKPGGRLIQDINCPSGGPFGKLRR